VREPAPWLVSFPAHVAGCALFAISAHIIRVYADRWHAVQVNVYMRTSAESEPHKAQTETQVNLMSPWLPGHAWVANSLAKQPPAVSLPDSGPDRAGARWSTVYAVYYSSPALKALDSALHSDGKLERGYAGFSGNGRFCRPNQLWQMDNVLDSPFPFRPRVRVPRRRQAESPKIPRPENLSVWGR
jgi:hypothetical protein